MHDERSRPSRSAVSARTAAASRTGEQAGMSRHDEGQRQRARRTALCVGAIAVAVYCAFILSGVIGR